MLRGRFLTRFRFQGMRCLSTLKIVRSAGVVAFTCRIHEKGGYALRLFIGLPPSDDVCEQLNDWVCRAMGKGTGRAVPKELYHITLAFLGERDETCLPSLEALIRSVASLSPHLPLQVSGYGTFGKGAGTILYAAVRPDEPLLNLSASLRAQLTQQEQAFDPKPLVPHITLARKAVLPDHLLPAMPEPVFIPDRLILYHSTRIDGELRYLPIRSAPFHFD